MKQILMQGIVLLHTMFTLTYSQENCDPYRELFENKTIVITGGAGFLGKGLIQKIIPYNPKEIRILSRDEAKHFNCQQQFSNHPLLTFILGDRKDHAALLYATKDANIVIDAGAHKRIDMMESNVQECIKTNIDGTLNVFNACIANNVAKALFISTDKSASPINIYGACKFVSEKIFTNYDYRRIKTQFSVVRYGNVLHSTGSVIPFFVEKIQKGEPLTLTDPRMTRFIISLDEAIDLIFTALKYSAGGDIFVKKLPALTILDLIETLKKHYHGNNPIVVTGIRPGEKLHETLINDSEAYRTYECNDFYVITPTISHIKNIENAFYHTHGQKVNVELFGSYSSDKCLISHNVIDTYFIQNNLYKY